MACNFVQITKADLGELMFCLSRINKYILHISNFFFISYCSSFQMFLTVYIDCNRMHDYAFVPTSFGDRLFQLRRIGESNKTTLLAELDDEDKAWLENEMKKCPTHGKKS